MSVLVLRPRHRRTETVSDPHSFDKLLVTSYTRDASILERRWGSVCTLTPEGEGTKFTSFAKYLQTRQKAASVQVGEHRVHILPPAASAKTLDKLDCLTDLPAERCLPGRTAPSAGSGILANILQSVKARPSLPSDAATLGATSKAAAKQKEAEEFEEAIRRDLQEFVDDSERVEHHFAPMEKAVRSLVHGLASEFEKLITASEGDMEERHVVVYKRGHEPADADLHVDKSHVQVLQPSKRKKQAKGEPGGPIADHISDISLIAAGQVKRDRRSVAQIQQEQQSRKKQKTDS